MVVGLPPKGLSHDLVDKVSEIQCPNQANQNHAPVTKDGKCGSKNGGTICGDWKDGNVSFSILHCRYNSHRYLARTDATVHVDCSENHPGC